MSDPLAGPVTPDETRSRSLIALVAAALLVAAYVRFGYLGAPFVVDAGVFAAMGKAVVEGRQLYVEIWDVKLPGVTLYTAPLWAVAGDRWWAWIAAQLVQGTVGATALGAAAERIARADGATAGAARNVSLGTCAIALTLLHAHWLLPTGFQLEGAMAAAGCVATYAVARSVTAGTTARAAAWALAAGCAGAASASLKPTGLAVVAAAIVACLPLARRDRPRAVSVAAALLAGVFVVLCVNAIWFTYLRVWPFLPDVVREIRLYGAGTPWTQIFSPATGSTLLKLAFPVVVLVGWGVIVTRRPPRLSPALTSAATFAVVWLALEVVGIVLQKRGYYYYFQTLTAPVALISGLMIASLRPPAWIACVAVVPLLALSALRATPPWRAVAALGERRTVAEYVREHTRPGDFVFADPPGELAVLADRRPGSRVPMLTAFMGHDAAPAEFSQWVIDDLKARRCEVVVLPTPDALERRIVGLETHDVLAHFPERRAAHRAAWARLIDYVHAHYTLEQRNVDGREIWRRKPATTQP